MAIFLAIFSKTFSEETRSTRIPQRSHKSVGRTRSVPFERIRSWAALVLERNPYYWEIGPQGLRLPYLDELVFLFVSTPMRRS